MRQFPFRGARRVAVIGVTLIAAACSYSGPATGPRVVTLATPGAIPPAVAMTRPGIATAASPAEPPAPRQGAYAGDGHVLDDPGGACGQFVGVTRRDRSPPSNVFTFGNAPDTIRVNHFVVHGATVSMGPFHGDIRPDGGVVLRAGQAYVLGRFVGPVFIGRYWRPGPACTYSMVLRPMA